MARSRRLRLICLSIANLLLPLAVVTFASGFFPFKPLLPGLATFSDTHPLDDSSSARPPAIFNRVIFMVVDALRSDFVYGHNSGFTFTQSLIRSGAAVPFTAHASPPTVTMPRIKAITTGSVPSFADLIFNLDEGGGSSSTLAGQDTWLAQLRAQNRSLVFYGDDTWLRLFPSTSTTAINASSSHEQNDFFLRAEGTTSFFVSDFTQVDLNVTRHLPLELASSDWDAMILHYLGLDHIGHKTGPLGPAMGPKQMEMDAVVQLIYEAMETEQQHERTLLVLLGDHGMNAAGNHGGSGPGETEPALLFASPKLKVLGEDRECPTQPREGTEFHYYEKAQQSDIVPTLAGLLGLPVSKNSLGVFARGMLGLWGSGEERRGVVGRNARQMRGIVEAAFGREGFEGKVAKYYAQSGSLSCKDTEAVDDELACRWAAAERLSSTSSGEGHTQAAEDALYDFQYSAQQALSNAASSYNIPRMLLGTAVAALALLLALLSFHALWPPTPAGGFLALTSLLYGMMMFASSYVEEEQHFWYWITPAWITLLVIRKSHKKLQRAIAGFVVLVVHRVAVRWNHTGQKHSGAPDIAHAFFPSHHILLWTLILTAYGYTVYAIARRTLRDLIAPELAYFAAIVVVAPAVVFKLNFTVADAPELVQGLAIAIREVTQGVSLVDQAKIAFGLLGLMNVLVVVLAIVLARSTVLRQERNGSAVMVTAAERLHWMLVLFLMTQSRAANLPLFLGSEAQRRAVKTLLSRPSAAEGRQRRHAEIDAVEMATTVLLLSHVYFFAFGGSNSISSVDLSNAYNGVGDYNAAAVGMLLFAGNWTGPVWWCSAAVTLTFSTARASPPSEASKTRGWIAEERNRLREDAEVKRASAVPDTWLAYLSCMTAFVAVSLLAVMAACTALRTHLFIWTVFSPKYLYSMAWCMGWHLGVNVGLGSLLRWLGGIA